MKHVKRSFAILLALVMVMGITPGVANAEGTEPINGALDVDQYSWDISNPEQGWSWDYDSKTLYLDGVDINTTVIDNYGLEVPDGATIVLMGDSVNTIDITTGGYVNFGIFCAGSLTIQGTGSLAVSAGNCEAQSTGIYAYHLTIEGGSITTSSGTTNTSSSGIDGITFHMAGGTVTATGGSAIMSYGVSDQVFSMSGGTLTATGGAASNSFGLQSLSDITMDGGILTATGAGGVDSSTGLKTQGNFLLNAGTLTVTGGDSGYMSSGIMTYGSITAAGGTLNASAGTGEQSNGIYAFNNIHIMGDNTLVNATATSSYEGRAFYAANYNQAETAITIADPLIIAKPEGGIIYRNWDDEYIAEAGGTLPALSVSIHKKSGEFLISAADLADCLAAGTMTLENEYGSMTFNAKALASLAAMAGENDVKITLMKVDASALTDAQRALIGDHDYYVFGIQTGETIVSKLAGGSKVTATIPFEPTVVTKKPNYAIYRLLISSVEFTTVSAKYDGVGYATISLTSF